MSTIRNRIAHASGHAAQQFTALVRRHIGFIPRGMTPGRVLLTPDPTAPGNDFINFYCLSLTVAASALVP
jgi:hypothetical protein